MWRTGELSVHTRVLDHTARVGAGRLGGSGNENERPWPAGDAENRTTPRNERCMSVQWIALAGSLYFGADAQLCGCDAAGREPLVRCGLGGRRAERGVNCVTGVLLAPSGTSLLFKESRSVITARAEMWLPFIY